MIEESELTLPEALVEVYEDARRIDRDGEASCIMCGTPLSFSESATELIGIRRLCTVPQVVLDCPECHCPLVIYAVGESPHEDRDGDLVFHQPTGGWWIGRLKP